MVRLVPNWIKTVMSEDFDWFSLLWDGSITDVFLIYKTSDNESFGDTLYHDLNNRKINTYRYKVTINTESAEVWNAEGVLEKVTQAIKECLIIIIIFNNDFAESPTCLNLLSHIIHNVPDHYFNIIPVFDGVSRSDLELPREGNFAEAFQNYVLNQAPNVVDQWINALIDVSILPGWKLSDRNTFQVRQEIRHAVSNKVGRAVLSSDCSKRFDNNFPIDIGLYFVRFMYLIILPRRVPILNTDGIIGLDSQLRGLLSQMRFEPDRVLIVGIHGDIGIGKTTLAQRIYDMIADHFDASCFIPHVRENSRKHGLERLQSNLLFDMTGVTHNIYNVVQGISVICYHLRQRKVLLVLDDVHEVGQLEALVGQPSYFSPGSIVIITTPNIEVLQEYGIVENNYQVPMLDDISAKQLLIHEASKQQSRDAADINANLVDQLLIRTSRNPMHLKQIATTNGLFSMLPQNQQGNPYWNIFGFLSSLVWLICLAVNPSIIHLIRGWDSWNIFLYVMMLCFFLLYMLLARRDALIAWYVQHQSEAFAVLIPIAIYTHYFDEAVDGKPDILDIISNIALFFSLLNLATRAWTNDKRFIIFVIIFGFILYCKKASPSPTNLRTQRAVGS